MPSRPRDGRRDRLCTAAIAGAATIGLTIALVPQAAASGSTATSNFQPDPNGFQFPNFVTGNAGSGFSAPTFEFTGADTFRMMGPRGCANPNPTAANCVTKPTIAAWEANFEEPEDGQCYGMAALSQLLFNTYLTPSQVDPTFGATEETYAFPNTVGPQSSNLQHEIGFWFASQGFKSDPAPATAPNTAVSMLEAAFATNPNRIPYVLELSDHAITPVGVQPASQAGWMEIQVYDNNFPDTTQSLYVNTAKNSFVYEAGSLWQGTGADGNLTLQPLSGLLPISGGTGARASKRPAHKAIVRKSGGKGTGLRLRVVGGRSRGARPSVRYSSPSHSMALAEIPSGAERYTLVVTNTDDQPQAVDALINRNDALLDVEGLRVAPHKSIRVEFDIPAASIKWIGAAATRSRAIVDGGQHGYLVDVRSKHRDLASGTAVRLVLRKGFETVTLRRGTRDLLRTSVTHMWVNQAGKIRSRSTKRAQDAIGGRPTVIRYR